MRKPNPSIDYTDKDYESLRTEMIEGLQTRIPYYTDTSQSDVGIVLIELLAKSLDVVSYYQDSNANETYLTTSEKRSSINKWCRLLGYTPIPATPAKFSQVFVLSQTYNQPITIPKGTVVKTPSTSSQASKYFETSNDHIIPVGKFGDEKDNYGLYMYTTEVVHGITKTDDLIGYSTGAPNQKFNLNYLDALPDTIDIKVHNGTAYESWTLVNSFIDSKADSKHFMIEQDDKGRTTIMFSDNYTGKIPPQSLNPIYANYRSGGGEEGNVSALNISMLDSPSSYIKRTFNPSSAKVLGTDIESNSSVKTNAPASKRVKWGLLQLPDYDSFIRINYSKEILLSSTSLKSDDPFVAEIRILNKPPYTMQQSTDLLVSDLTERNIVGGSILVLPPLYKIVDLTLSLIVLDFYDRNTVKTSVESYINDFLSVGNYPFGEELILSSLCYDIQQSVEGIKSLRVIDPVDDVIAPTLKEIIQLGTLTVNAIGGVV